MAAYGLLAAWPFLLLHPPFTDPPMAANFCFSGVHTSRSPSYTEFMLIVSGCFSATNSQDEADFWEAENGIWGSKLKRGLSISYRFFTVSWNIDSFAPLLSFPIFSPMRRRQTLSDLCITFVTFLGREAPAEKPANRRKQRRTGVCKHGCNSTKQSNPRHLQFYWIHKSRARPMTVV